MVLGTNPHPPLKRRYLGATVDKVVDHAPCSVLVVSSGGKEKSSKEPDMGASRDELF